MQYNFIIAYIELDWLIGGGMIEGDLNNLVRLDEQNNIKRQKQLYNSHLKFDPERPIYQHPLNLNNYIDLNN